VLDNTRENGQQTFAWALRMREIVNDLRDDNHETIAYLIRFLAKVAEHEDQNRMSPEALSVVFAPNILAPPANDPMSALADMKTCEISVRLMIEHADAVFP
jgi:myosin-9